jgi:hypothetical protein
MAKKHFASTPDCPPDKGAELPRAADKLMQPKFYKLCLLDYAKSSWAMHDIVKNIARHPHPELPPVFYKFFPSPDAQVRLKPPYQSIVCPQCRRYDTDEAFKIGFFEPATLRFKEHIGVTDDHIDVVADKCLAALKRAKVGGYETKPIGKSGWHAFRVTLRFDPPVESVVTRGKKCPKCGRPEYVGVKDWEVRHVVHPSHGNTFYTTAVRRVGCQQDIFFTGDVLDTLKAAGIKGPYCERFQTHEEVEKRLQLEKQGKRWLPKDMTVYLSG